MQSPEEAKSQREALKHRSDRLEDEMDRVMEEIGESLQEDPNTVVWTPLRPATVTT
jgi:hypothetical protein